MGERGEEEGYVFIKRSNAQYNSVTITKQEKVQFPNQILLILEDKFLLMEHNIAQQ